MERKLPGFSPLLAIFYLPTVIVVVFNLRGGSVRVCLLHRVRPCLILFEFSLFFRAYATLVVEEVISGGDLMEYLKLSNVIYHLLCTFSND